MAAALAFGVAACADGTGPTTTPNLTVRPNSYLPVTPGDGVAGRENLEICKYGSSATIYVSETQTVPATTTSNSYNLNDGDCYEVADFNANGSTSFTVTETSSPSGYQLDSIRVTDLFGTVTLLTGTQTWSNTSSGSTGFLVEFFNSLTPPPGDGCTNTIGYWKNWDGSGPQADVVSALLPITLGNGGGSSVVVSNTTMSHAILDMSYGGGAPSNGISKLMAQLLGAKLSIANGASNADVAATITAADTFLTSHSVGDWSSLSKAEKGMVNGWMTALDDFNNGITGPGHCG